MSNDAAPEELPYSELRQARLSAFEARLYRERAGLGPHEAVRWWERFILSGEARDAIAAGLDLDQAIALAAAKADTRVVQPTPVSVSWRDIADEVLSQSAAGAALRARAGAGRTVVFRVRQNGTSLAVERLEHGTAVGRLGSVDEFSEALRVVHGQAAGDGTTINSIVTSGMTDGDVLDAVQPLASVLADEVAVGGRPCVLVDGGHLVPTDPTGWAGYRRDGFVEGVGSVFSVRDITGEPIAAGVFPDDRDAVDVLSPRSQHVALLDIQRWNSDGRHRVIVRQPEASIVVSEDDRDVVVDSGDLMTVCRSSPSLCEVREHDVTEIRIHPLVDAAGVSALLSIVLAKDNPIDTSELVWPDHLRHHRDDVLPPDLLVPAVWVNGRRLAGVFVEGQPPSLTLVPVAASARHLTPGLVTAVLAPEWASLTVSGNDGNMAIARFTIGAVTDSIAAEVRETPGELSATTFTRVCDSDRVRTIAGWLRQLDDELMGVDVVEIATDVLRGGVDGPGSGPTRCKLQICSVDEISAELMELLL